jgi:hypothetical protein
MYRYIDGMQTDCEQALPTNWVQNIVSKPAVKEFFDGVKI